eukprot:m.211356 g.211356  ORF g.211356 m.211356 type:complete len:613 (+) comp15059_c2_seq9:316-2154(+)
MSMLRLVTFFGVLLCALAAQDRPNIVMLFVDDLGYGDVGFTGHPTTKTPNIDKLASEGKVLTSWYSGCSVCSGSRAALMTGRQFVRVGVAPVLSATVNVGLPPNETTVASQLKKIGYKTGAVGKWHLGQREVYLPANHGFDKYFGIPYSDDMGYARIDPCNGTSESLASFIPPQKTYEEMTREWYERIWQPYVHDNMTLPDDIPFPEFQTSPGCNQTNKIGTTRATGTSSTDSSATSDSGNCAPIPPDPARTYLPLMQQIRNSSGGVETKVLEQPLDFTSLAQKYSDFATDFIEDNKNESFFLYMPFSHVHTTAHNQPERLYCGCAFKNKTTRGAFGDALAEVDWIVGNVVDKLQEEGLDNNTLILFTGDNGPWLVQNSSGGSVGLFYARSAGYWNVGKASTWEGGIREAAFARWPGRIPPNSRSSATVSSLDLFPTLSSILNIPMPTDRVYDGRDMSNVLFTDTDESPHDFLFFYQALNTSARAVRYGDYKAHFVTAPGSGGCSDPACQVINHSPPLLFNVAVDPTEAYPLTSQGVTPTDPTIIKVLADIEEAYKRENVTMTYGNIIPAPDGPGEGPGKYGVCCDRAKGCDCNGSPYPPIPSAGPELIGLN